MVRKRKTNTNKLTKKPKLKLPSYSAEKILMQMAKEQGMLVSPYDPRREQYENPQVDNRSLYFKEEYKREKQKRFGGFI